MTAQEEALARAEAAYAAIGVRPGPRTELARRLLAFLTSGPVSAEELQSHLVDD